MTPDGRMDAKLVHVELQMTRSDAEAFKRGSVYYGLIVHVRRIVETDTVEEATFHSFVSGDGVLSDLAGVERNRPRLEFERGYDTKLSTELVRWSPFSIDLDALERGVAGKLQRVLLVVRPIGDGIDATLGMQLVVDHRGGLGQPVDCLGQGPPPHVLYCEDEFKDDLETLRVPYDGDIERYAKAIAAAAHAHARKKKSAVDVVAAVARPPRQAGAAAKNGRSPAQASAAAGPVLPGASAAPREEAVLQYAPNRSPRQDDEGSRESRDEGWWTWTRIRILVAAVGTAVLVLLLIWYLGGQSTTREAPDPVVRQLRVDLAEITRREREVRGERDAREVALGEKTREIAQLTLARDQAIRERDVANGRTQAAIEAGASTLAEARRAAEQTLAEANTQRSAAEQALADANAQRSAAEQASETLRADLARSSQMLTGANQSLLTCRADLAAAQTNQYAVSAIVAQPPAPVTPPSPSPPVATPTYRAPPILTVRQQADLRGMFDAARSGNVTLLGDLRRRIASNPLNRAGTRAGPSFTSVEPRLRNAYRTDDVGALQGLRTELSGFQGDDPDYHAQFALVYAGLRQTDAALKHAQKALILQPGSGDAYLAWAIAAVQNGQFLDAEGAFCALQYMSHGPIVAAVLANAEGGRTSIVNTEQFNRWAESARRRCSANRLR